MSQINTRTREHYNSLLTKIETDYIDYRWRSHPLQRLHYLQTRRSLRRALDEFVGQVSTMLEVGCGPGTWTPDCMDHTTNLTLLDISREMLREARTRFDGDTGVSIICGDFTSGVLDEQTRFDVIVAVRSIEYMSPKLDVVRQAGRLLKPGGTLVLITKNPGWRDAKEDAGFEHRDSDGIHSDWISWGEISRVLRDEGMDVLAIRPAAMGSYEPPFSNAVGRRVCHWIHRLGVGQDMSTKLDALTESYLVVARRPKQ